MRTHKLSLAAWRTALLALCLFFALAVAAAAEGPATVDELVAQGTGLAEMNESEMQELLKDAEAAKEGATADEQEKLDNLVAAIHYNQKVLQAAEDGTLDELEPAGVENSWRYQNGSLVVEESASDNDISLATFNAPNGTHLGIDVSRHNGTIDWDAVKNSGIEFAILRCGIGSSYDGVGENKQDDAQWERNISECERLSIPYGVYLYSYATSTAGAENEAYHTLNLLSGHSPQLPVFYDLEDNCHASLDNGTLGDLAQTWCGIVQNAGYNVGIYSYQNFWQSKLTDSSFNNSSWYRWVACYITLSYTGRMDAWQFSSSGSVNGISTRVDMNYWYGDLPTGGSTTPTPTPRPTVSREAAAAFATRLYTYCLDRSPDAAGLNYWVDALVNTETGSSVAYGFVFSPEFKARNYCNADYIKHLYLIFLDRAYDAPGLAYWEGNMNNGMTREEVFNGFALSNEFTSLCSASGIIRGNGVTVPAYGTVPTGPCPVCGEQDGVTSFVTRLYQTCLDRKPDATGLQYWCNNLWAHSVSGRTAASGFIFSDEFTAKGYDNSKYLDYLYEAMMDRAADSSGKAYWLAQFGAGKTRQEIFNGFVESTEFTQICNRYGIVRG